MSVSVKDVVLYITKTWVVTKAITHKVQTSISKYLRYIQKIKWQDKISNTVLVNRIDQTNIKTETQKQKRIWIAHN